MLVKFVKANRSVATCFASAQCRLAYCQSTVNDRVASRPYGASISGHGDQKNLRVGCAVEFSGCRTEVASPIIIYEQDCYLLSALLRVILYKVSTYRHIINKVITYINVSFKQSEPE